MSAAWGAIAETVINLGQWGVDLAQKAKYQRKWNELVGQRPSYAIPESYKSALDVYQKLASSNEYPGQSLIEQNIQQSSARARTAAERGSISSASYGGQVSDIYDKELQAIQNLGIQAAQYKADQQQNLAKGLEMMGNQEAKKYEWDVIGDWTTRMNQIESRLGAATQNAGNAFNTATESLSTISSDDWRRLFNKGGNSSLTSSASSGGNNPGGQFAEGE